MDFQTMDISNPEMKRHAYELYRTLRTQQPVVRVALPHIPPFWLVTRYADVVAIFKDDRFVKDHRNALTPEELAMLPSTSAAAAFGSESMIFADGAKHRRLRSLVSKAFTPRRIEELRPRIQQLTDQLIDELQNQPSFDLMNSFAAVLPVMVISEMLGVPFEDRTQFRRWTDAAFTGANLFIMDAEREQIMLAFGGYIHQMITQRRSAPTNDLVSALLEVHEAGDSLTEEEMMGTIFLLMVAGHETTRNLIGNAMLALLNHPEQKAMLQANPTLMKNAIEELLRYDGAVEIATFRFASTDIEFQGQQIPRGEQVILVIGSADRDPEQFESPDDLDITREIKQHVAFGHGVHICLGAPLARLEGQIAISSLLQRLPNLELAVPVESLNYLPSMLSRGVETLPVKQSLA